MAGYSNPEVATKAVLERMIAEKLTVDEMAERLKIHRDSVRRALRRHKLVRWNQSNLPVQRHELARVRVLGADGAPSNWIAEDVGLNANTVQRILGPRPEAVAEWRSVWQAIRQNDALYALHCEVAPKARQTGFSDRRQAVQ